MNKVKIIIEGYAKMNSDRTWLASSTTTLVTAANGTKIIVDPGCNRKLLLRKLVKVKIKPEDIDYIFLTHHHLDHAMNVALFTKARVVDIDSVQDQDVGWVPEENIFGEGIKIIKTPGHEPFHASLLVETDKGKICVAGDVFWWEDGKIRDVSLDYQDDFAFDMESLKESRKKILKLADWIIPGHGEMFKV